MNKTQFTGLIKLRGWSVNGALEYWGRSYDWYTDNCNGNDKAHIRLKCLIDGLPKRG